MSKLAVWSIEERAGDSESGPELSKPDRVGRSHIGLEKYLEDWIVKDVSLIGEGLTLVGRQVEIDERRRRLDLLAIDSQDRWVVIELKAGLLQSDALHQALYYASSLARLEANELCKKLCNQFDDERDFRRKVGDRFDSREAHSAKVRKQVDNEGEEREIALMLAGTGISSGVERMSEFLGRFGIPIEIVSFEVFKPTNGPLLLVREVIEELNEPAPPATPKRTVEAIRDRAVEAGVVEAFNRFVSMSEAVGLAVQPQKASIRIAPPQNRTRYLMYAQPYTDTNGAGLWISVGGPQFVEFFPEIDEQEATAVGREGEGGYFTGAALNQRLDEIEAFLDEHFPKADANEA